MWFVLELREHVARTNDLLLKEWAYDRVMALMKFFERFENEHGLLEKLERWVFIEWSKANEFTQDVNYPSNMLYAETLAAVGELYCDDAWIYKAQRLKDTIRKMSFNGEFFTDHAVRVDGKLVNDGEATEVCQYYAFFFGVATPELYPELWKTLVEEFGPDRAEKGLHPKIWAANAFVGNYLRLDILSRYGLRDKMLENIEGYFHKMAVKTGTLWENDTDAASCDHGFASHVAVWLAQAFGTVEG
jgi:alpha-L-rhamnosidase